MTEPRALVLNTGKALFDEARAKFTDEIEYVDLRVGSRAVSQAVPAFTHDRETLEIVDALMARLPFQHVLATSESNLAFAAFLRSRYGLEGMGFDEALVATNKWRMKRRLQHFFPTACFWLSGDFAAGVGSRTYPPSVVMKPLSGSSSRGVRKLPTEEALSLAAAGDELLLVEEAIDVDGELHCDGVMRDGRLLAAIPSAYDRPVLSAVGTTRASIHLPPTDPRGPVAVAAAQRITAALGIRDFVFHLELLQSKGRLLFGEIGLRPAGGGVAESLRHFYGVDLWEEYVRLQLAKPSGLSRPLRHALPGYRGVIGIAAPEPGSGRCVPPDSDLLAVPGVVKVSPGMHPAAPHARTDGSCAFSQLAFFTCSGEQDVHDTVAHLDEITYT
ncbi:acetyl-CoA carboxylase biotin carboxylase subunit family protein [Streptomyces sp. NPDC018833]|uniref:acetyl-CoA carboxylase biotin carboxylase subunit family protein n=1 Tax=Streptomyces sp. NPDC018833 TaxID=3365053 RepID=UPI0037A9DF08